MEADGRAGVNTPRPVLSESYLQPGRIPSLGNLAVTRAAAAAAAIVGRAARETPARTGVDAGAGVGKVAQVDGREESLEALGDLVVTHGGLGCDGKRKMEGSFRDKEQGNVV